VAVKQLSQGTAVRHFNVMQHMMAKASTIWLRETGIEKNRADLAEVKILGHANIKMTERYAKLAKIHIAKNV
jgi:hypothetical protein